MRLYLVFCDAGHNVSNAEASASRVAGAHRRDRHAQEPGAAQQPRRCAPRALRRVRNCVEGPRTSRDTLQGRSWHHHPRGRPEKGLLRVHTPGSCSARTPREPAAESVPNATAARSQFCVGDAHKYPTAPCRKRPQSLWVIAAFLYDFLYYLKRFLACECVPWYANDTTLSS